MDQVPGDLTRSGCVVLLGAGASIDAGYPMAADLLARFQGELARAAEQDEVVREQQAAAVQQAMAEAESDPNTTGAASVGTPIAAAW